MDKLDNLKFFIRLVEKGGVAAAGRDFGMSPATASERLAALEAYYGAKLFNRTTRSVSLTEEGQLLIRGARALVNDADDLKNRIRLGQDRVSGKIRIAAPQDLGANRLAKLLDAFVALHSAVEVELHLEDKNIDLVANGIDLAVRLGSVSDSSLKTRKLADNRRLVIAAPSYLETHGTPKHPNDLTDHNCLVMHWGDVIDREWLFKINGRKKAIAVSGNRSCNNGAQIKHWCLAGHGIALKSNWDVQNFVDTGELVEVLTDFQFDRGSAVNLLYPGGGKTPRRVRALIDFLVAHFNDDKYVT